MAELPDDSVKLIWKDKHCQSQKKSGLILEPSHVFPNVQYDSGGLFLPVINNSVSVDLSENRFMEADNLDVLDLLERESYAGKIDLIYIDPPYYSSNQYLSRVMLQGKNQNQWLARPVFDDSSRSDLRGYLHNLFPRLVRMREFLSDKGSIFVHLDWHAGHYVKVLMDEIFGPEHFINEIVWCYGGGSGSRKHFHRKHDIILWYGRGRNYTFNPQYRSYSTGTLQRGLTRVKGDKYKLHEEGALLQDWWTDINKILSPTAYENLKFPTQKPAALIKRLIAAASNPGDLVADFYCGSGTVPQVCEEMDRKWLACDISSIAASTTLYRLLQAGAKPFRWDTIASSCEEGMPGIEMKTSCQYHPAAGKYQIELIITDYIPAVYDQEPNNEQNGRYLIDFWEIDTDYDQKTFRSSLQILRKDRKRFDQGLCWQAGITVEKPPAAMAVRVHDVFGRRIIKKLKIEPGIDICQSPVNQ